MATNTDWSKFQRLQLVTLLEIQEEVGNGNIKTLEKAIIGLKATMEKEDVERVYQEMSISLK